MQIISEMKLSLRDDYFIENYLNDPRTTPEAELITQILVPTA
jgi:DNA gyrase inhibitor GyrI